MMFPLLISFMYWIWCAPLMILPESTGDTVTTLLGEYWSWDCSSWWIELWNHESLLMLVLSIIFIVLRWQWALCHIRKRIFLRYVVVFVSTIFGWPRWHWEIHRCGTQTLRCALVALHNSRPLLTTKEWSSSYAFLACFWWKYHVFQLC